MQKNEEVPKQLFLRPPKSESTFGDLTSIQSTKQTAKANMFQHLPSDSVRDISAFLDASSLGSLSTTSTAVHSDLDRVMTTRQSEYLNRPPTEVKANGAQIWRDEEGKLHRINGPAVVESNGSETWYYHGWMDREDGPAVTEYYEEGRREEWRYNDNLHRKDGPALVEYNKDGIRIREEWWYNGKRHRKDGPAVKVFEVYEYDEWGDNDWYGDNDEWRDDDWRGEFTEEWWENGVCHVYDYFGGEDGKTTYNVWWSDCFE